MKVMYLSIYLCCEFIALTKNEQITQILRLISRPSLVRQARCILFPTTLECWSFCLVPMLVKFAWEQSTHAVCGKQNLEEMRKALQKFETFASDFLLKRCHGFRATKTSRDIAMWHHKAGGVNETSWIEASWVEAIRLESYSLIFAKLLIVWTTLSLLRNSS